MARKHTAYKRLQRHLNRQAVGFPATRSGAELEILAHIFSPEQALIAACLSFRFESLQSIYSKAGRLVASMDELARMLADMQAKGGIESRVIDGNRSYRCIPLVVGMYEFQLDRLTPAFLRSMDAYTAETKFGIAFLSTERPQMRTIPIAKSITPQHHVSTWDEIRALLQQASPPFVVVECICRKKRGMEGKACRVTQRKETCMAIGHMAQSVLDCGVGREISLDEALSIIETNQRQGLVLQPSNTQQAEFICSCCGCCCGMLGMHRRIPVPVDFWASNYHAVIDSTLCDGCGNCAKRCQVGAAKAIQGRSGARIDLKRCIGCGLCVPTCAQNAVVLARKPVRIEPPRTREALYDTIMSMKKGPWARLVLTAKLIADALRTGQRHLIR